MLKPMALAATLGLVLAGLLIVSQDASSVFATVASVGIGMLWVTLLRIVQIVGAGVAWWVLLPGGGGALLKSCIVLRWVREAINALLPVAQVGGDFIGGRLLAQRDVGGGLAGASILVDLLVQTATLIAFALLGVFLLAEFGGDGDLVLWILLGLALLMLAVTGFFLAQRMGGFAWLERGVLRLAQRQGWQQLGGIANLHAGLERIYKRPRPMMIAVLVHLAMWFVGAIEIWVALAYMGQPVGYMEALAIESLGHAARAAGFLIPAGLGVQEGGFIAICLVLGIPAPTALALSLIKRMPEVFLGLPGLFAWHVLETRTTRAQKKILARLEDAH
jgi:putative membrane protein